MRDKMIWQSKDGRVLVYGAGPIERWSITQHRFEPVEGFAVVIDGRTWRPWLDQAQALYLAQMVADNDHLLRQVSFEILRRGVARPSEAAA